VRGIHIHETGEDQFKGGTGDVFTPLMNNLGWCYHIETNFDNLWNNQLVGYSKTSKHHVFQSD
jgi:hypothetical protein